MPLDRPTRNEILDAVTSLLDSAVKPRVEGPLGYDVRIAIHLLRVLRRELDGAPALEARERTGLDAMLADVDEGERTNAELCARIRDGRIRHSDPTLRAHLAAMTMAKLAIDQPNDPLYQARLARQAETTE